MRRFRIGYVFNDGLSRTTRNSAKMTLAFATRLRANGARDIVIRDPDGHVVSFDQLVESVRLEE